MSIWVTWWTRLNPECWSVTRVCVWGPHLFVAQIPQVEGDPGQLVALTDVEHRHGVASIQQLLHQVSAQEPGPSDHSAPFITLNGNTGGYWHPRNNDTCGAMKESKPTDRTRVAMVRSKHLNYLRWSGTFKLRAVKVWTRASRLRSAGEASSARRGSADRPPCPLIGPAAAATELTNQVPVYVKERHNSNQSRIAAKKDTPRESIKPIHR